MGSRNPERLIFDPDRAIYSVGSAPFVRDQRGWILFGPHDIRGNDKSYLFCLQKLPKQKTPRVRVGCRYYTLREAWAHWGARRKGRTTRRKNECAQAVALIRLMLLQAQAYGLISMFSTPIKFDRNS